MVLDSSAQATHPPSTTRIEPRHLPSAYVSRDNLLTQVNSPNTTLDPSEQDTQLPSTKRIMPRHTQSDTPSRDSVQNLENAANTYPLVPMFQNPLHSTETHLATHFHPSLLTPHSHITTIMTQQTSTSPTTIPTTYIFPPCHFQNHPHTTKNSLPTNPNPHRHQTFKHLPLKHVPTINPMWPNHFLHKQQHQFSIIIHQ